MVWLRGLSEQDRHLPTRKFLSLEADCRCTEDMYVNPARALKACMCRVHQGHGGDRRSVGCCRDHRSMLEVGCQFPIFPHSKVARGEIRYGKTLVETCAIFKSAEAKINERVLGVQSHFKRTSLQLPIIKQIWQGLDEEHQTFQTQILQMLSSKLSIIISRLGKVSRRRPGRRSKKMEIYPRQATTWWSHRRLKFVAKDVWFVLVFNAESLRAE